jgi:hypothetical protein
MVLPQPAVLRLINKQKKRYQTKKRQMSICGSISKQSFDDYKVPGTRVFGTFVCFKRVNDSSSDAFRTLFYEKLIIINQPGNA